MKNKSEKKPIFIFIASVYMIAIIGIICYGVLIAHEYRRMTAQQEELQEKQLLITCKAICPENTIPYLKTRNNIIQELRCLCYDLKINGFIDPFSVSGI